MPAETSAEKKPHVILVIDDDQPMMLGIKFLLERSKYTVITAESSSAGIDLAIEHEPDLIICDIMMPLKDGFEVRKEVSANPLTRDTPFLFVSARASQTDKLKGLDSGADDYITKPFDPRELLARIEAVFRRQEKDRNLSQVEMQQQIERIQNEISHNISHELRTPMTQILLSLDTVLRIKYDDPNELRWFVETALSQSHRLNALIDDLTFLSNYDMGRSFVFRQQVDLQNDFMLIIAQRHDLYKEKNLQLNIEIEKEAIIHAPRREFRQAISHLVDNSMKFSAPDSSIFIKLTARGNGGCTCTITDAGPGIPPELQEKVFERFYQISQGDTRNHNGLGVGLTIARIVARSLEGDVTFLPVANGTSVQFTIPPTPLDIPT